MEESGSGSGSVLVANGSECGSPGGPKTYGSYDPEYKVQSKEGNNCKVKFAGKYVFQTGLQILIWTRIKSS